MKKLFFLVFALVLITWGQASADYNFTYVSNDSPITADITGYLNTLSNGPGPLQVTGGSFSGTFMGSPVSATLVPGGPGVTLSPLGAFNYDNQLSPGSNPMLDFSGLLFATAGGTEINIYGNNPGPSDYTYMQWSGGVYPSGTFTSDLRGTFAVNAVPEPLSLLFLGFGLVGIVGAKRKLNG